MINKLGIVQGRLSEPKEGFQRCPENWQREFDLLEKLSLHHIEWIVVQEDFETNPIFHANNIDLSKVSGVCLDNLVDERIDIESFLYENLAIPCEKMSKMGIVNVAVPLLEKSSLERDDKKYRNFCSLIRDYADQYKKINFLLETEMSLDKVEHLCGISENIKVTYDTGNTTSFGINHSDFINTMFSKIENVHLKDRTFQAVSKPPTMGDTDFMKIFHLLKMKGYDNFYTLQTMREKSGEEETTIARHINILREIFDLA